MKPKPKQPGSLILLAVCLACAVGPSRATAQEADQKTYALDGNRTYEVLLPPQAQTEANRPLVLYLHPSGNPRLEEFKRDYWPLLRGRKCMAVIPLSKSDKMWLSGEDKYVEKVLEDVRKRHKVDAGRILLLGISGGGQLGLFLAGNGPEFFRAVIVVSTNPVVVRGNDSEWFYPADGVLKKCPYFVVNHITQGSALMYWRQVRAKLQPKGASISILPVLGKKTDHYLPPPKELGPWLDAVLAGKHPSPLPDPQKAAVAKMFAKPVSELLKTWKDAAPAPTTQRVVKGAEKQSLSVAVPADFERSKTESSKDSAGRAIIQIRIEHKTDPIYVRCEARSANQPMNDVLTAEEKRTSDRGMLYQVYHRGGVKAGGRQWTCRIGSITFPHRKRGWQSTLFIHAFAPTRRDGRQWLEVMVLDETQQPSASQLAPVLRAVLASVRTGLPLPKTTRAK